MFKKSKLSVIFSIVMSVLLILLLMTGCGSKSNSSYDSAAVEESPYEGDGYYSDYDSYEDVEASAVEEGGSSGNKTSAAGASNSELSIERKIIRDGEMYLQAEDVNEAYSNYLTYIKSIGGYEFNYSFSEGQYDGSAHIDATFKLPPDKLTEAMQYVGNYAKVINSNTSADDITNKYYDYKTRLETMEKSLERYYTLLESADSVDSIITIQRTIDDLTMEIESLKGQIKLYDSLTDEATLTVSISQTPLTVTKDVEWDSISLKDMGRLSSNGFISVVNTIWSVIQWLIIIIIAISPLLVLAAIVIFIIVFCVRRSRKKKAAKAKANAQAPIPPQPPVQPQTTIRNPNWAPGSDPNHPNNYNPNIK